MSSAQSLVLDTLFDDILDCLRLPKGVDAQEVTFDRAEFHHRWGGMNLYIPKDYERRNREILAAHHDGTPLPLLCRRFGLSLSQIREIIKNH